MRRDVTTMPDLTAIADEDAFRGFGETWGLVGAVDRALAAVNP